MNRNSSEQRSETDWKRIDAMRDEEIDTSDIPELDASFFKRAKVRMPGPKDQVTIRLDHDVLEWFRGQGKGYQSRINAVLRAFKEAQG
jgi:uncharacterized protein (DUF4415 family)